MMGTTSYSTPPFPPPTQPWKSAATPTATSSAHDSVSVSNKHLHSKAISSFGSTASTTCSKNYEQHKSQQPQKHQRQQQQHMFSQQTVAIAAVLVLCSLIQAATATPVFVDNPSLAQFQSGRNIRHLPCIVRKSGRSGVCMFAIDCIKSNGTHLGTCIDRFYFGSCCQMNDETAFFPQEISDNSIDQNTISHFVHESTTLPTSALFKLTTESPHHLPSAVASQNIATTTTSVHANTDKGTTAELTTSNKTTTTTTTTSGKPVKPTYSSAQPPKRISANTTHHKISQFVVRTTTRPKPLLFGKPTIAPTTIKPPKRRTTIAAPILTTTESPKLEQRIETTTQAQKFYTFQMVETTTPTPTEPTVANDELLLVTTTQRPRPSSVNLVTRVKPSTMSTTTTRAPMTTTSATTTTTTTRPTTVKTRPTIATRWPTTTRRTTQSKRPTRRPTTTSTTEATTKETTSRQPIASADELAVMATNETEIKVTLKPITVATTTTRAPRPTPKPTAEIVKVPRPTVGAELTTMRPRPVSTIAPETTSKKPTKTTQTPTTTTRTRPKPNTTTSTRYPTRRPVTTTTTTSSSTITSQRRTTEAPTTTTTTKAPITKTTTEAAKPETPPATTTTLKPGLVTWTNVDGEPQNNTTVDEEWQPRPPPSDWVPVPTIAPETQANKTTTVAPSSSSTQKIIVSITSSVSEMMNNVSIPMKPPAPALALAPTMSTTSTTPSTTLSTTATTSSSTPSTPPSTQSTSSSTTSPKPTTTLTTATPSTTTTTTIRPTFTTDSPIDSESSTSTETVFGTGTSAITTEYSTEDYNATMSSTTAAPVNTLEGVNYRQVCGRRMFPEPRIVGGANAAFGRWPWQISLRQWRTSTYLHKCGAALLNENWAITAAHCVDNVPPSDLLLRLGEYDLAEEEEPYGYQERRVQIVASHPQFDPRTFEYDLALLRFYEPVVFQPNIIPVCVPENDQDFIGETAFVTGWGRLYEDGPLPSVLQEVAVPVINNTICETMYRAAGYIEHIPHIFICAGWKKGGYDSCEGDSGGPMVLQREEDKRFQLGGVISWGIGCAEPNQPGVYTRISEFRDWINQILQF